MSIIRQNYGAIGDNPTQAMIAPVFYTYVATTGVSSGNLFIIDNVLYKATTDIEVNDPIVIGTNASLASNVSDELISKINNVGSNIEALIDSLVNSLKRKSISLTKTSALAANVVMFYNPTMAYIDFVQTVAGSYTADLSYNGYYYVKLASVSDTNIRKIYPNLSSSATSVGLGEAVMINDGGVLKTGALLIVRASASDSTWYLACNAWRRSGSGTMSVQLCTLCPVPVMLADSF